MDENCPYCNASIEINHDDGYGYSEGEIYEQECPECGKTFCYTSYISYNHELFGAPCKNGEPHKLTEIQGYPKEFFEYKRRCEYCGDEIIIDEEKHKESSKRYFQGLKQQTT